MRLLTRTRALRLSLWRADAVRDGVATRCQQRAGSAAGDQQRDRRLVDRVADRVAHGGSCRGPVEGRSARVRPRAGPRVPACSSRAGAQPGCPRSARAAARTLEPRLPSSGLRVAAYRARGTRPSVPSGRALHGAPEPGEFVVTSLSSRAQARRRGAGTRDCRRTRAGAALPPRADAARDLRLRARPGVSAHREARGPHAQERNRARQTPAGVRHEFLFRSFGNPSQPSAFAGPGGAHNSGRISLRRSGSDLVGADQAASGLRLQAELRKATPHRANQHPYRPASSARSLCNGSRDHHHGSSTAVWTNPSRVGQWCKDGWASRRASGLKKGVLCAVAGLDVHCRPRSQDRRGQSGVSKVLGWPAADLVGTSFADSIHPKRRCGE